MSFAKITIEPSQRFECARKTWPAEDPSGQDSGSNSTRRFSLTPTVRPVRFRYGSSAWTRTRNPPVNRLMHVAGLAGSSCL